MKANENWWLPLLLILVAVSFEVYFIVVSAERPFSSLESALIQVFSLLFGWAGSFYIGKHSATDAAKQLLKPHARSAFRRLASLFVNLRQVLKIIDRSGGEQSKEIAIAKVEAMVRGQLRAVDDALQDWQDVVPEEVEEFRQTFNSADIMEQDDE